MRRSGATRSRATRVRPRAAPATGPASPGSQRIQRAVVAPRRSGLPPVVRQAWHSESAREELRLALPSDPRQHQEANDHCGAGGRWRRARRAIRSEARRRTAASIQDRREKGANEQGSALEQKKREGISTEYQTAPSKAKISQVRDWLLALDEPVLVIAIDARNGRSNGLGSAEAMSRIQWYVA